MKNPASVRMYASKRQNNALYQQAKALLERIPKDILDQAKREARQAGKQHESR